MGLISWQPAALSFVHSEGDGPAWLTETGFELTPVGNDTFSVLWRNYKLQLDKNIDVSTSVLHKRCKSLPYRACLQRIRRLHAS